MRELNNMSNFTTSLEKTAQELRAGRPAIFPTDTVCGVGVSVLHAQTPAALYELKRRPAKKPIAWLVGGVDDLQHYGEGVPEYALALAQEFWPGALTLVVYARAAVPQAYLCGGTVVNNSGANAKTLGLRCPASPAVLQLIEKVGSPLCTTSANFSGDPAPTSVQDLDPAFARDMCVLGAHGAEGSETCERAESDTRGSEGSKVSSFSAATAPSPPSGTSSTVIDCTGAAPKILREGSITEKQIMRLIAHVLR